MLKFSKTNGLLIIICVLTFLIVFTYFKNSEDNKDLSHTCEDRYTAVFDLFKNMSEVLEVDITAFAHGNADGHQMLATDLDLLFRQFRGEQNIIDSLDKELGKMETRVYSLEMMLRE